MGGQDGGIAHKLNDPKEIYFSDEFHNHNILSELYNWILIDIKYYS